MEGQIKQLSGKLYLKVLRMNKILGIYKRYISSMCSIIAMSLLMLLVGCNQLPNSWGANSDFNPSGNVTMNMTSVYVYANNPDWTDSGVEYNGTYSSVSIFENTPGYSGNPDYPSDYPSGSITPTGNPNGYPNYLATASGTVMLCGGGSCGYNSLYGGFFYGPQRCSSCSENASPIFGGSCCVSNTSSGCNFEPFIARTCQYINGVSVINGVTADISGSKEGEIEDVISSTPPPSDQIGIAIPTKSSSYTGANTIPCTSGTVQYPGTGLCVPGQNIATVTGSGQSGHIWLRIVDRYENSYDPAVYLDNSGRYLVNIQQPVSAPTSFFSELASFVITPITMQIQVVSQNMFVTAEDNLDFKTIIRTALILYIVLYGFTFLLGFQNFTQRDLVGRIFKVGIVLILISDGGINYFNNNLFYLFQNGQTQLINLVTSPTVVMTGDNVGTLNYNALFSFANYAITTFFSSHFFTILAAFLMWFPIGWICLILLLYAIVVYIFVVLEVVIAYIIAYTAIGLLIALAPIFIPLLLFEKTRHLFDGWISAMVSYTMEPVVLFAAVTLVSAFVNESLYDLMNLQLQSTPVLDIFIDFGSLGTLHLFWIYWINPVTSTLDVLTDILIFYVFIEILKKVTTLAGDLSNELFEGNSASSASGVAQGMIGTIKEGMNAALGAPVLAGKAAYSAIAKRSGTPAAKSDDDDDSKRSGISLASEKPGNDKDSKSTKSDSGKATSASKADSSASSPTSASSSTSSTQTTATTPTQPTQNPNTPRK